MMTIDPGMLGGIAWVRKNMGGIDTIKMPLGMTAQADFIRDTVTENELKVCIIEDVGRYMPGNSGPSAVTFASHCGELKAILYMCGMRTVRVSPQVWMKMLGFSVRKFLPGNYKELGLADQKKARGRAKIANKNAIKEEMARRYPYIKVTLAVADALGSMEYARKGNK